MQVRCPFCSKTTAVPDELLDDSVRCPWCKTDYSAADNVAKPLPTKKLPKPGFDVQLGFVALAVLVLNALLWAVAIGLVGTGAGLVIAGLAGIVTIVNLAIAWLGYRAAVADFLLRRSAMAWSGATAALIAFLGSCLLSVAPLAMIAMLIAGARAVSALFPPRTSESSGKP